MRVALNSDHALDDVLNLVAAHTKGLCNPDIVIIGSLDARRQTLSIQAGRGLQTGDDAAALALLGYAALVCAIDAGQAVLFKDGIDHGHCPASLPDKKIEAVLAVPVVSKATQPQSGILLYYTDSPLLSAENVELATLLGDLATLVIDNARTQATIDQAAVIRERNRIACDLHDSTAQTLYTINLIAEALPEIWHRDRAEGVRGLEKLRFLSQYVLAEMRALLLDLHEEELARHTLAELLRQVPDRVSVYPNLKVTTTIVGDGRLPTSVRVALYRIAQEALNNVYKHASASRVSIQLHFRPDRTVMLRISDNGRGLDPNQLNHNQLGLRIMRERAHEIGALLTIENQPGQGAEVVAIWQAAEQAQDDGQWTTGQLSA